MAELGRRKSDLEKKLSEPLAPQEIGALGLELQAVTDALAAAEESWLALSEQIELEK
jgi:ATP-binding cassette subfamily F protein 3